MAFLEFCCRSGGSNLNAGTRTGNSTEPGTSADLTYASGSWVQSTRVFTVASGDPAVDGVAVGDYVSIYADGSTVTGCIGRVSARTSTTITLQSYVAGSLPTDGTSNRTIKVGGAWQGPNGSSGFPFSLSGMASAGIGNYSTVPRINMKNDVTYSITAAITQGGGNYGVVFQGYTSAYADGGRATIDGGTSGSSYTLLTSGNHVSLFDLIFSNNGATGSSDLVSAGQSAIIARCVFHDSRGSGLAAGNAAIVVECEAYACNASNTSNKGGFAGDARTYLRSISHDNSGSNSFGFRGDSTYVDCIADTNGGDGFRSTNTATLINCDSWNNGGDGAELGTGGYVSAIDNSNFLKNAVYGVRGQTAGHMVLSSCGFGAGSQANTSGATTGYEIIEIGTVTYPSGDTPWVDPANGDFRINHASAKGAGRGAFTQTATSYAGTVGYPDIGAAQHQDAGGGGGGGLLAHPGMRGGFA